MRIAFICGGLGLGGVADYTRNLAAQLRPLGVEGLARVAPEAKVIVSGLPPAETATAFHRPLRDLLGFRALLFTRLYRAELAPHGISVFDIAKLTKSAFHGKREMFSADMFHPSSAGYAFLGTVYGRAVREALDAATRDLQPDPEAELAG